MVDAIRAEFVDEACLWLVAPGVGTDRLRAAATAVAAEADEAPEIARVASLSESVGYSERREVIGRAIESVIEQRLPSEYELSRHALRALCRGTVTGAVAPRELTRWGYNRFVTSGGHRETALLYDLYLLDEDYELLEHPRRPLLTLRRGGSARRPRRTEHDVDERVLDFARRVAARPLLR